MINEFIIVLHDYNRKKLFTIIFYITIKSYDYFTIKKIRAATAKTINAINNGRPAFKLFKTLLNLTVYPFSVFISGEAYLFPIMTITFVSPKSTILILSFTTLFCPFQVIIVPSYIVG